ncbi:MAG: hypothetical protein NTU44_19570 [Bacteroidetes bacterium]|nr:hypothetical protein [Bacteroidota bacterium]
MTGKKDRKSSMQPLLSPEKYIRTKARQLPLYKCFITENWKETGAANIVVSRCQPSGNFTVGFYYVDLFCCGVKDTLYLFNIPDYEFENLIKNDETEAILLECTYELAHNIIYGAIAYAEELGLKPHKDWSVTQYILEEDTEDIEFIDIQFGRKNGRPMLISTSEAHKSHVMRTLDKTIGRDAYDLVEGFEGLGVDMDDEYDDMDDVEEEDEDDNETFDPDEAPRFLDLFIGEIVNNLWILYDSPERRADKLDTVDHIYKNDYPLTTDPLQAELYNITGEEIKLLQDLFNIVIEDPEAAINRLAPLVKQYPRNPIMHNYLMKACFEVGRDEQATQLILEGYEKFPDYLLARCNYAHYLISEERYEEVPAVFGGVFDLKLLYPDRKTFHVSEFENFYDVIARYYLVKGRIRNADHLISQLRNMDLDTADTPFHSVLKLLWHKKLSLMFGGLPVLGGSEMEGWKPAYKHNIIKRLLEKGVDIDESVLRSILALPSDEWVADLKQGVFEAFIKVYTNRSILSGEECPEIVSHAFFLIGECGNPAELDYLLAILGQDYEILKPFFGDLLTEKAWMPVYRLGQGRLETLYEFCISEYEAINKSLVSQALVQIALQEPTKKEEVAGIFRRLFDYYLNFEEYSEDDHEFINDLAWDITDLHDPSFIPVLNTFDERKLLDKDILGSLNELVKDINDPFYKPSTWPVQNIFEIYRDVVKNWN